MKSLPLYMVQILGYIDLHSLEFGLIFHEMSKKDNFGL